MTVSWTRMGEVYTKKSGQDLEFINEKEDSLMDWMWECEGTNNKYLS
jgi:hypothetical protein